MKGNFLRSTKYLTSNKMSESATFHTSFLPQPHVVFCHCLYFDYHILLSTVKSYFPQCRSGSLIVPIPYLLHPSKEPSSNLGQQNKTISSPSSSSKTTPSSANPV